MAAASLSGLGDPGTWEEEPQAGQPQGGAMEFDVVYQQFVPAITDELDRVELGARVAEHLHYSKED
jgi:hypothetical protein